MRLLLLSTLTTLGVLVSGCANDHAGLTTASIEPAPEKRGIRVAKDGATRVFFLSGFDERCAPLDRHLFSVTEAPQQGQVSFQKHAEPTTVQYSVSGKCLGQKMPGTVVLYTPGEGARGRDLFTISAATAGGAPVTRQIIVDIAE